VREESAEATLTTSPPAEVISPEATSSVDLRASVPGAPPRVAMRYWTLTASHTVVDLYPPFIFWRANALQAKLMLSETQAATLFALNPIVSGLAQPLFAWIGDRLDTRLFAPLGLALGALGISLIGFATNFQQLIALQFIGMAGVGIFHPISSALAGQLGAGTWKGGRAGRSGRSFGLSVFFAFGMAGGVLGPLIATRINVAFGMGWLALMALPGLLAAAALWVATARVPHRNLSAMTRPAVRVRRPRAEQSARVRTVAILFIANSCRYFTNIGLFYLFKEWAKARRADPDIASSVSGDLIAASQLGMAISAILIGRLIRPGAEKIPMVLSGLVAAPIIMLMPDLGRFGILAAASLAAVGYFGVIPASIALAQRMLPGWTGAVGALLMGCGWAVAAASPYVGEFLVNRISLHAGFYFIAGVMAFSGLLSLFLPSTLLQSTAADD